MDDKNRFWIGYYHQKARKSIQLTRQRIGHRIKELRESKGMSQRELGKRIDIAYNHIGRIEKGKYNVNLDTLAKIAAALDTEINLICEKAAPES
ncbi:MAG: helix-turn-helix transcriptional regulator [Muribaculaceae bacterium]|nr:helix-turn-helix transcriptional regulator [Muribaculaceae bacterium]